MNSGKPDLSGGSVWRQDSPGHSALQLAALRPPGLALALSLCSGSLSTAFLDPFWAPTCFPYLQAWQAYTAGLGEQKDMAQNRKQLIIKH